MSKQELVDKNEVLSIWHNYWESDKLAYEAEDELRELKTIICITELNENQQIVLNRLKNEGKAGSPIGAVYVMVDELEENLPLYYALASLKRKEHAQILRTFAEWVIEQEESK